MVFQCYCVFIDILIKTSSISKSDTIHFIKKKGLEKCVRGWYFMTYLVIHTFSLIYLISFYSIER